MNSNTAQAGVLYIDDTIRKLDDFKNIFKHLFNIYTTQTVAGGYKCLAANEIGVVIINQHMPDCSGIAFFESILNTYPYMIRIVLTGYADSHDVTEALNRGLIYKHLAKPWQQDDLKNAVEHALEVYSLRKSNIELSYKLCQANYELLRFNKQLG